MQEILLTPLTAALLALQFAAFGWRVNREISVGDQARRTWFPLPDIVTVLSLFGVVALCVVVPLSVGQFLPISKRMLAGAATLIAFYPLTMAAHYGLFRNERPRGQDDDFLYAPPEEIVIWCLSLVTAGIAAALIA